MIACVDEHRQPKSHCTFASLAVLGVLISCVCVIFICIRYVVVVRMCCSYEGAFILGTRCPRRLLPRNTQNTNHRLSHGWITICVCVRLWVRMNGVRLYHRSVTYYVRANVSDIIWVYARIRLHIYVCSCSGICTQQCLCVGTVRE